MAFKFYPVLALLIVALLPLSCSSIKELNRNHGEIYMYGIVFDEENQPVSGAEVIINGKAVTFTDAQGRFILTSKERNSFSLTLNKTGFEPVTGSFSFEPMQVIHLVMINSGQLVRRAERFMDEGFYPEVINLCERALVLNPARYDASYLKALALLRLRDYQNARKTLEELQNLIGERDYIRLVLENIP